MDMLGGLVFWFGLHVPAGLGVGLQSVVGLQPSVHQDLLVERLNGNTSDVAAMLHLNDSMCMYHYTTTTPRFNTWEPLHENIHQCGVGLHGFRG
jgi:hypothetical protein